MSDGEVVARAPVPNYGIDSDRLLARDTLGEAVRRRWDGRYAVDEFGGDPHLQDFVLAPLVGRIPVEVTGGERLPRLGAALLVANRTPGFAEPFVLSGAVLRTTRRRLRLAGFPNPPLLSSLAHKLGGIGRRAGDVAAVLRAGHLVAAPLTRARGAGEVPRDVVADALGFPLLPVAIRRGGPAGLPLRPWLVSVGTALAPPEGTEPGDPLAAAELCEEAREAIAAMLRRRIER